MSAIAALFNVPGTPEELAVWSAAHATHHRDIQRVIYQGLHIALPEYVLDPIDPNNTDGWAEQHQVMHQNMDEILGIPGFDLSEIDFKNKELLAAWIQLNANEHYQASNILEIG